jgi:hypothetical protein
LSEGGVPDNEANLSLAACSIPGDNLVMTATAVIEEIEHLPPEEQSRVIQYAIELARRRQLTGKELGELARRMVETKDPAEADRLQEDIVRGFYGNEPHA